MVSHSITQMTLEWRNLTPRTSTSQNKEIGNKITTSSLIGIEPTLRLHAQAALQQDSNIYFKCMYIYYIKTKCMSSTNYIEQVFTWRCKTRFLND